MEAPSFPPSAWTQSRSGAGTAPYELRGAWRSGLRVALLYLLFGVAWIVVTDRLLPRVVQDIQAWQTYKGLVFVAVSAGVIGALVHRELTARRRAERGFEEAEERYRTLFEQNEAGVFRSTPDGELLDCNQALAELLGFENPDELIGSDTHAHYADPDQREEWIERVREEGRIRSHELRLRSRDGSDVWALMTAGLVAESDRDAPVLAGTLVDVTGERMLRDQLEAYAYHDALTGLPNRRSLKREAGAALSRARREDAAVGLLYVDVDRFKRINNTLGHDSGDRILYEVARRLQENGREEDVAGRIGGDEFAVLLNTVHDVEGALAAADRVREAMDAPFLAAGRSLHLDVSIGIALFPDHGEEFQDLLARADEAMSRAASGETRVAESRAAGARIRRDQLAEEEDLRAALEEDQLELHYQPVYRIADRRIVGAEALARWRHPELGLRSPGEFIPVAERSGLIRRVDRWVVGAAAHAAGRVVRGGKLDWVSVNLSAQSLEHEDVFEETLGVLGKARHDGGGMVVEVTESTAMRDPRASAELFRELHESGIRVAIDDFGTGHSALAYLKDLPADIVKLDMIFVQGIEASEREDRLLHALVELGKTLGVEVVAEGVETAGQYERLGHHGCPLAQGYHLGRPMPVEELEGRIARTPG